MTRVLQFGSEPLFDGVLDPPVLKDQVLAAKDNLSYLGIPVTVSDMAYSYQEVSARDHLWPDTESRSTPHAHRTLIVGVWPYWAL